MNEASSEHGSNHVIGIDRALVCAFDHLVTLAEVDPKTKRRKNQPCVPTGFRNIDQHIDGLWPGELTIVAGDHGVGKTSLAANLAISAAKQGVKVLFVSLGEPATTTAIRMCAAEGRMRVRDLLQGRIFQNDWETLADLANKLTMLDLHICDDLSLTPEELFSISHELVAGAARALVVIDGIECSTLFEFKHICDQSGQASIAAFLKRLARTIDSPVLATLDYRPGTRRRIRNYDDVFAVLPHGAGSMADSILHIDRSLAEDERNDPPRSTIARITIAKSHMCAPAEEKLTFMPECMRFMSFASDYPGTD